ncbi:MAG: signal recognition particle protein [Eubacteriales bacterium]|nr:signal recognition particle protein [Eubacteriales bacterium]
MFSSLSDKLSNITRKMRGQGRISEADLKEIMREIRLALLEADVNYQVVKDFTKEISSKAKGAEVMQSLTPGNQVVKIVRDELIEILGSEQEKLAVDPSGFTKIIIYGLQGAGKTTTSAKLAKYLKDKGKKPFLVSVDVHRPAAQEQLKVLADSIGVPVYIEPDNPSAVDIVRKAEEMARYLLCDTFIVDTAGRMTIDEEMMNELAEVNAAVQPHERLLVVDAMIGQEAVNVALEFDKKIGLDGFIMTKLDGDARGGAALSIRKITGKPIKMIGIGEKIEDFDAFYPDRMASRILGMGDVLSLIEKAEQQLDEELAQKSYERMRKNQFTLDDLLDQFLQIGKMGGMEKIMTMLPGSNRVDPSMVDDSMIDKNIAIIRSMTSRERHSYKLLNASRRKRIAAGSGTSVQEVNQLIRQFEQMQQMMKQMKGMSKGQKRKLGRMFGQNLPF